MALVLWVQPSGKPGGGFLKPEKLQAAENVAPVPGHPDAIAAPKAAIKSARPAKLENLDRRAAEAQPDAGQHAAAEALRQRIRGTSVQFDPVTAAPSDIMPGGQFLTGPNPDASDPDAPVRDFLAAQGALFGHGSEVLAQARRIREDVTAHNGLRTVVWQQELDGVPLYDTILRANLTRDGQLAALGSHFIPEPAKAAAFPAPKRNELIEQPPIDAAGAISLAAADLGDRVAAADSRPTTQPEGRERRQRFEAPGLSDVVAGLTWLPLDRTRLRLGWDVTLMSLARSEMFRTVVDAATGEILVRTSRTADISDATYRVYANAGTLQPLDSPAPLSPSFATPVTTQPGAATRSLITTAALDETASPNGWINDGGISSYGNNVDAHLDVDKLNPNPGYGAGVHAVSATRNFDFTLDLTKAPSQYRSAALTQLFFTCNWFHDRLYQLGFTEAAGNFQQDNFGRGGAGNDAVIADAQDVSGTENSNFSTPTDGGAGRLQMFLFPAPNPDRDGDLDSEVVLHECAHGLSNRLVGGGIGITALQSRGLGEGWSDFYALSLLSGPLDNVNGNYALGAYVSYLLSGVTSNYYYGIRRYPYSTDLTKNPLTLKDIDPARASAHTGIPLSPQFSSSNGFAAEFHCQGEVWCSALWDARANLVNRYGGFTGNATMLQLVTDAMKLTPANPTFLQARDAVLQADLVNNGGANRAELWNAFAKRGLGSGATVPASSSTSGVIEAFDFPDELTVTPGSGITASGPVGGPFTPGSQAYTLKNTSSTIAVGWTALPTEPWMSVSQSSGTLAPGASAVVTMNFNASATGLVAGSYVGAVTFTDTVTGLARACAVTLAVGRTDYFTEFFDTTANDTSGQAWLFTPNGSTSYYSVRRSAVTAFSTEPAGGSNLVLLDDDWVMLTPNSGAFSFYGATYGSVYVGSNGYLTFGSPDTALSATLAGHFSLPRISALFTDLVPRNGGNVSWKQLADRIAITFSNVPEYGAASPNSFQFELFFDGRIRITCLQIGSTFGIIGLSRGQGIPSEYIESDFSSYPSSFIQLSLPALTTEGAGVLSKKGVVTLTPASSVDVTVALQSNVSSKLLVPGSIVIPAGQATGSFDLTVVDNALLDGTQSVTVTASTALYGPTVAGILVQDNETATLALSIPGSTTEGAGTLQGTVSVNAAPAGNVTVLLTSSDPGAVTVPPGVMIVAGQTSANFAIGVIDDQKIDGPQPSTITAHIANWTDAAATITVQDNEPRTLGLTIPAEIPEGTTVSGTISLSGTLPAPLTVTLASANPQRVSVPASVIVPAGSLSASFSISALENALSDGSVSVALSADAPSFTGAAGALTVRDNDAHHYVLAPVASPQMRGGSFAVTVAALDATDLPVPAFTGAVSIGASAPGAPVSVSPTGLSLANGTGSGNFSVSGYATGVVLTATDSAGRTGSSNPFDVGAGAVHHFAWNNIPSPRTQGFGFPVTVTAQDSVGNAVASFNGPAVLSATSGSLLPTVKVLTYIRFADATDEYPRTMQALSSAFPSFSETSSTSLAPADLAADLAGKNVFLVVEQEYSSGGLLDSLGQSWAAVLHDFVAGGGVLIICSHQQNEHLLATRAGLLNATKVGDVSSASLIKPADTPLNAGTAAPFTGNWLSLYNSTDATVSLADSATGGAVVLHKDVGQGHVVLIGTDFYVTGTQMDRVLANAVALAQTTSAPVPLQPATTGVFQNGVWTGGITIAQTAPSVRLRVEAGSINGTSNPFDIAAPGPLPTPTLQSEPAITGGLSNALAWSEVPGAELYEAQASTDNFATTTSSGWSAATTTNFTGLTEGAKYSYRVRARNTAVAPVAESPWSDVVFSTQDAIAPAVTVTSPAGLSTSTPTIIIQGKATDLSGIQTLLVNGVAATTSDDFAHWSVTVTGLHAGANHLAATATDGASPPNTSSSTIEIAGVAPADANQNGLPDEWEAQHGIVNGPHGSLRQSGVENFTAYALGLNPNAISFDLLPRVGTVVDPGDGLTYLTFTYRRRLDNIALDYGVEISSNLSVWTPGGNGLAELPAPSLNSDGFTETVTVRVSPAIQPGQQRYLRLRVSTSQ